MQAQDGDDARRRRRGDFVIGIHAHDSREQFRRRTHPRSCSCTAWLGGWAGVTWVVWVVAE